MIVMLLVLLAAGLAIAVYWLCMSTYSQAFGDFPWRIKTDRKVIALTFDDGPNEPYTSQIVDFLHDRGVKATFFQVGICVKRYPETSKRILREGHIIGNHSLSHAFHNYLTHPGFEDEVTLTQTILKDCIGKTPALFRSPWLWRQPFLLRTLRKHHLQPVSGEFCHPLEVFQINGATIAKSALKKAKPGSIIIFHDGFDGRGGNRAETVKAAKIVVDTLLQEGYEFVTVDKLLSVRAYQD